MPADDNKFLFPPVKPVDSGSGYPASGPDYSKSSRNPASRRRSGQILLAILPGLMLILLGGLFWLAHYGLLEGQWWQYFLVCLGGVIMIESLLHYRSENSRWAAVSRWVAGIVMIVGGLLYLFNPNWWWPLVLICLGLVYCLFYLYRYRRDLKSR